MLSMITQFAARGLVKKDEVTRAFNEGANIKDLEKSKGEKLANVLYFLGGAVVFIGISILIFQNWSDLNEFTRVLATLGIGLAMYVGGILLSKDPKYHVPADAFLLVSLLVVPTGLFVLHDAVGFQIATPGMNVWLASIMVALGLVSRALLKKDLFTSFSIVFGTWLYFSLIAMIIDVAGYKPETEFFEYVVMALGVSFLFLGYSFVGNKKESVGGALYGVGSFIVLGAAIGLGGWAPDQSIIWELFYPLMVFGFIFASVYMKIRSFLVMGSMYLMAFLVKISAEYFADSLGWPLVLVLLGLVLMGVGYGTFYLDRKYVKEEM